MSLGQPPKKRRKLSNNQTQNINDENSNVISNETQPVADAPDDDNESLIQKHLQQIYKESNQWHQYIHNHLPPLPPIHLSESVGSNTNHTKINELKLKNEIKMPERLRTLTLENNKLKLCVRALAQIVKEGPSPQHHLVPMIKTGAIRWSKAIESAKNKLNKYFILRYNDIEIDIEPAKHGSDNDWIDDIALRKRISNHIFVNGINNSKSGSKPFILIKQILNNKCFTKVNDIFGVNECFKMNLFDYIEAFQITSGHRISSLEGKIGLRAKRFIPKGTVLGQYIGREYFASEFDTIYEHSNEWDLRNMYAFDVNLYIPSDIDETEITQNLFYYETATKYQVIIDGFEQRNMNPLIYINDCRQDIDTDNPTKIDESYWNCSFRTVVINGWPSVFALTRRDVNKGESFNIFYGDNYGVSINKMNQHQLLMARLGALVDDKVLKILGIDKDINMNDVYTLDL